MVRPKHEKQKDMKKELFAKAELSEMDAPFYTCELLELS